MNTLVNKFFATDSNNWSLFVSRLALGIVILPHGMQKALGSFGGYGFEATLGAFTGMGMPMLLGVLVILAEFVGAIVFCSEQVRVLWLSLFFLLWVEPCFLEGM